MSETEDCILTIQELHVLVVSMIAESGLNHLSCMPCAEVIDEPLVRVASGDDPLFARYKTIIGAFHMTPREGACRHGCQQRSGYLPGFEDCETAPASRQTAAGSCTRSH